MDKNELSKAIEDNMKEIIVEDANGIQHYTIQGVRIDKHGRIVVTLSE